MATSGQRVSALFLLGVYAVVSLAAVLPFVLAEHPPLHDYYHWMFVGYLLSHFLARGPTDPQVAAFYELDPSFPPNAAAPLGIGLLGLWFPLPLAARVFASACALGLGFALAYLVRTVQRCPTVLELGGFVWAHGFLMYNGYLSDQFALALSLVAVGLLHRAFSRPGGPGPTDLAVLTLLGTATCLGHVLSWVVLATALGLAAMHFLVRGRARPALLLAATLAPAVGLLIRYALTKKNGTEIMLYRGWHDKVESLVSPLLPFLRTDPFPSPFPTFWANVVIAIGLGALVLGQVARPRLPRTDGLLASTGALLLLGAIAIPFKGVGDSYYPDARLVLPGVMLLLGSLAWSGLSRRRAVAITAVLALILGAHALEYRRASGLLAQMQSTVEDHVAPGTSLFYMPFSPPRLQGTCVHEPASYGTDVTIWFDLERLIRMGAVRTRLMQTSLVRNRPEGIADHWVETVGADEVEDKAWRARLRARTSHFEMLAVVRCPADAVAVRELFEPSCKLVAESDWLTLLRCRPPAALSPGAAADNPQQPA